MMQLQSGGGRSSCSHHFLSFLSPPPHHHLSSFTFARSCRCFIGLQPRHSRSLSSTSVPKVVASMSRKQWSSSAINAIALVTVVVMLSTPPPSGETLLNIPPELSGEVCDSSSKECKSGKGRIQRPNSRNAESCMVKCVTTCIRGGDGSPGEGPLNIRSLVECSDICNLLDKAEKGR
ncbi:hypothetical protein Cgig2_009759 [Carnegiea gigantea]|uniref:Uncharacterized protein n=1 Tax=Carnegiea gigantea TaxID=171969 RepID=A0A9Q1JVB7_9CARY|nr:hypothetical protein Cgig2_009759 [Carnegiea gigantea]